MAANDPGAFDKADQDRSSPLGDLWRKTDQVLVQRCLAGDGVAWDCLIQRYKRLVYHFAVEASLSQEDCDEVFQETFLALYRQLDQIQNVDHLSYWISRVAQRNTWRAVHKTRKWTTEETPALYDVEDPNQIADAHLELKLQQAAVRRALTRMEEPCRTLLTLLFYAGPEKDYRHVAEDTGLAIGSIGPTRNRCLLKFKKLLAGMGIDKKTVSKIGW